MSANINTQAFIYYYNFGRKNIKSLMAIFQISVFVCTDILIMHIKREGPFFKIVNVSADSVLPRLGVGRLVPIKMLQA